MQNQFVIDVISDVICPWCFLGKRRLDKALASLADLDVVVRWRPYALDPSIPPEGLDRTVYLTNKFGAERLATLHDPLIQAGLADGVPYNFEAIARTPNTLDAHRLIRWAHTTGLQNEMAERLFMSYWSEGKDIGDRRILAAEAGAVGINGGQIAELLDSDQDIESVKAEIAHATTIGVTGVPTFIFAQSYALVGAQSADILADAITRVARETV